MSPMVSTMCRLTCRSQANVGQMVMARGLHVNQVPSSSTHLQRSGETESAQISHREEEPLKRKAPGNGSKRWLHYNTTSKPTPTNVRERNIAVTSYYNQTAIDIAADKKSVRLTPATIMYSGRSPDGLHVMKSAQYLQKELPIRIAHRIAEIRSLPFIVGCNPSILSVHELYIRAFHILNDFPDIITESDEEKYSEVLRGLLEDHKDVLSFLAQGFKECRRHIKNEDMIRKFLDRNLTSRLGIRMLATHHLRLRDSNLSLEGEQIGMININMCPKTLVERWASFIQNLVQDKYGHTPDIRISGHVSTRFPYIEMPLDYILPELLKNSARATIEAHPGTKGKSLPPIYVTIATNERDFIFKISDRGGGIPHDRVSQVMQYNFSTAEESTENLMDGDIFGGMMDSCNRTTTGPIHGYGFGLPTSRAYADYLGGSLTLESMQGLGTDVYLRLKHFNAKGDSQFRI